MFDRRVGSRLAAGVAAVLAIAALCAPAAWGVYDGNSPDTAFPLKVPDAASATIDLGHSWVMYSVIATAGQTVRISATTQGAPCQLRLGTLGDPYVLASSSGSTSTAVLTFMPPRTGSFLLAFNSDATATCSISTTPSGPESFTVGSMWAPASVRHSSKFSVAARTFPAYNSLRSPIRFVVERKSGKKWKAYGGAPGSFTAQFLSGGSSKTTATIKLTKKGTYRIRARLLDLAHPVERHSVWKTVKVK